MKHQSKYFRTISFILAILVINTVHTQVSYRDTTVRWNHFEYSLNEFNGIETYSSSNIVESSYEGIVLENEYLRLVLLPGFGGRILSYYFKPTQHEQFYLNPVGTPYGIGDGNFYYDWLMVMGGVFPTFPEPEHGKTWFLSWDWEFTEIKPDKISLQMTLKDTINYPYHPGKFNNGITGIICSSTITVESGKTSFDLHHLLLNPGASNVPYEYWTCCTFAPGSDPGDTYTPANSEIIAPIDYVYLKDDWWGWMGMVETPASGMGPHVFEYNNLAIYENWDDMGIAYAHPSLDKNFYGVINHNNEEGVFRVAENLNITRGMKFWTWGANQGLNADPQNFYQIARPYIELWSGISTQFFEDSWLNAGDSVSWNETYLPSVQMGSASEVNNHGILLLDHSTESSSEQLITKAYMTLPDSSFNIVIQLEGPSPTELYNDYFIALDSECHTYSFDLGEYNLEDGEYIFSSIIYDYSGNEILTSDLPIYLPLSAWGTEEHINPISRILRQSEYTCSIEFSYPADRVISLYSSDGKLVSSTQEKGESPTIRVNQHGIYIIRVLENGNSFSIKLFL